MPDLRDVSPMADFVLGLPKRPLCSDDFEFGSFRRQREIAVTHDHIQLNPSWSLRWLIHDIDQSDAYFRHRNSMLPEPTFIAVNPKNGHAHSAYRLRVPVAVHENARHSPIRLYAAVERGLRRRLGSDRNYVGLLVKNPLSPRWRTEWRSSASFELSELAGDLTAGEMMPERELRSEAGAGRNVQLFDALRTTAYAEVRNFKIAGRDPEAWFGWLLGQAQNLNSFDSPLRFNEVRAISRSVGKWTWRHFSPAEFSSIQSERGRRGMASRWKGHTAASRTMPWVKSGTSRATYYRQKQSDGD